MKILSIEPTPNPNSMKLNLDETLPAGAQITATAESAKGAPEYLRRLLQISGVRSVYRTADFLALERAPNVPWAPILTEARALFEQGGARVGEEGAAVESFGEVRVFVQMFRGIPMQIKLLTGTEDVRVALPERFGRAAKEAASAGSANFIAERKWIDRGIRYGDLKEIGEEIASQIAATYSEERLQRLAERALNPAEIVPAQEELLSPEVVGERLNDRDWKQRYAALEQMDVTSESLAVLERAVKDPHASVRRLATVLLGQVEEVDVLPHLLGALKDPAAIVRRAAGDCLSDKGDERAVPAMAELLTDTSKLVRWRAARFLYEVGDASILPALRAAQNDPEFEIALQVQIAIERIEGGKEAAGPAWQQMIRLRHQDPQS